MQHLLTSESIGEVDGDCSSNVEKYAEEDDNEDWFWDKLNTCNKKERQLVIFKFKLLGLQNDI